MLTDSFEPIEAVIFDLDDTLYPQADYLAGAWREVARAASEQGLDGLALYTTLLAVAASGSDQGRIIDKALELRGYHNADVLPLVEAFLEYRPAELRLFDGVSDACSSLQAAGIPVAVVTDGSVQTQKAKIDALSISSLVDHFVLSDDHGREFRKPHPRPMMTALTKLRSTPGATVVIGDRPDKDIGSAAAAGIRGVRVRTGEYAQMPDHPFTWMTAEDVPTAVNQLRTCGHLKVH